MIIILCGFGILGMHRVYVCLFSFNLANERGTDILDPEWFHAPRFGYLIARSSSRVSEGSNHPRHLAGEDGG